VILNGGLPRGFREHPEYGENQRFSLQIVRFGIARGADDLFPYLRQPCKARKIGVGVVGSQLVADPAIDAIDESRKRDRSLPPRASPSACSSRGSKLAPERITL